MESSPEFNEDVLSKLPALQLLINMGYKYLSIDEALKLRGNRPSNVLLEDILVDWLRKNNQINFKGEKYPFSEGNIHSAVQSLKEINFDGLIRTNEKIFDILSLGKSLQQSINGDSKSFTINYIDWNNPKKNVYHITEEYKVERSGRNDSRRPDIVLFVNGIPFCIIECKSPNIKDPEKESISQQIRNQKEDEIPKLFLYSQVLISIWKDGGKYGTTGTPLKFWSNWKEDNDNISKIPELCNQPLDEEVLEKIYKNRDNYFEKGIVQSISSKRRLYEQDKLLYRLCRPERLLDLTYKFILFDFGEKKIARYQQYFSVKKIISRIINQDSEGKRQGGVVWHTQGSGKSITMVFLAKSLSLMAGLDNYKIILVTDRVDLDDQIYGTFSSCGKELVKARTGRHLADILQGGKQKIITTIINKFENLVSKHSIKIDNPNIFVLVDEGHRTQYGPLHVKMKKVLPKACYIAFTGTPILKKNKDTISRFGGIIDKYSIERAVEDKAVVPLLYEGRHVIQSVDSTSIDSWFKRITSELTIKQTADLKKKFSTTDQINKTEQKIALIAWDISEHFRDNWKRTGFKGQLVAQDKAEALMYKKYLDEYGMVSSEIIISGPDEREGEEDLYKENKLEVQKFWKSMMEKFGNEKEYNKQIINSFKHGENPEILIVVSKLLTGFDAPRNTILYLTRKLKDHTLLQAIARVNRLYEGKDFGYIIDYRGVLEDLDKAFDLYNSLSEFDMDDINKLFMDISEPISDLPQKHSLLWDTFKEIKNINDEEEFEILLSNDLKRQKFYERLSNFSRVLSIAFSSLKFIESIPDNTIEKYQKDLKFFIKLRSSVRRRYAETVDFGEYEPKIQKLLNTHVKAKNIEQITPLVNIFDKEAFETEVEKLSSVSSKADTIAHRTQKSIYERMEEDPAFYKKFSEMLKDVISDYYNKRIQEKEYLKKVIEIMNSILNRTGDNIPEILNGRDVARAYFGILKESLYRFKNEKNWEKLISSLALNVDDLIEKKRIVRWIYNQDVQNKMKNGIEDLLFKLKEEQNWEISLNSIDDILEKCINVAKIRRA